jgi:hypothetical protein
VFFPPRRRAQPAACTRPSSGPDCAELADICALAAGNGDDPLAGDRRNLKRYLLGPYSPNAQTRFNRAAARLAERAGSLWRAMLSMPAPAPHRGGSDGGRERTVAPAVLEGA